MQLHAAKCRLQPTSELHMLDEKAVFIVLTTPVAYIPLSTRLLDQLREILRYKYYSLRTEEAYLYWVKFFVRWLDALGSRKPA